MGKANSGKSGNGTNQEMVGLIMGLKHMGDLPGCCFLLDRLEHLSVFMDAIEDGEIGWEGLDIGDLTFWQRKIIGEIRNALAVQDQIYMKMKNNPILLKTFTVDDQLGS